MPPPPSPHSLEEELDFIIDIMRNSDAVRIRRQFKSYSKLAQDIQPGGVYAASRQHAQTADQVERPPGCNRGGE